jgi:C4-type Zn-finger protein
MEPVLVICEVGKCVYREADTEYLDEAEPSRN